MDLCGGPFLILRATSFVHITLPCFALSSYPVVTSLFTVAYSSTTNLHVVIWYDFVPRFQETHEPRINSELHFRSCVLSDINARNMKWKVRGRKSVRPSALIGYLWRQEAWPADLHSQIWRSVQLVLFYPGLNNRHSWPLTTNLPNTTARYGGAHLKAALPPPFLRWEARTTFSGSFRPIVSCLFLSKH